MNDKLLKQLLDERAALVREMEIMLMDEGPRSIYYYSAENELLNFDYENPEVVEHLDLLKAMT